MDRSRSSEDRKQEHKVGTSTVLKPPVRTFTLEFIVGIFSILGCLAAGYLAIGLGGLSIGAASRYQIVAEFDNISGLEKGASIEIAGVPIGEVSEIYLQDPAARVVLSIDKRIKVFDQDIASIRTKGIIGDRYIKISRGGSDREVATGTVMIETESVVDIEDIIGKIVHSMGGDKSDEKPSSSNSVDE